MSELIIPGTPIPKPRMTQRDRWKNRPCVRRFFAFRDLVRGHLPKDFPPNLQCLNVVFFLPFPKSYSRKKREALAGTPNREKPDLDNLVKSLLDCCVLEDKQVSSIMAEKKWCDQDGARTVLHL